MRRPPISTPRALHDALPNGNKVEKSSTVMLNRWSISITNPEIGKHTSELSHITSSYAVFCLKKKTQLHDMPKTPLKKNTSSRNKSR